MTAMVWLVQLRKTEPASSGYFTDLHIYQVEIFFGGY